MPLCFIDVESQGLCFTDTVGTELESREEIRREVAVVLADELCEGMKSNSEVEIGASVRNDTGSIVYKVTLTISAEWLSETD